MSATRSDAESTPPPSILSLLPGSSYLMRLPGSGLLVRGENLVRNAVAGGLRWVIGNTSLSNELISDEEHRISQNYNELRSAVQELVDMFDQQSIGPYEDDDLTNVDLLMLTKNRVSKLEKELEAEQKARRRAEARVLQLEHNDSVLVDTASERRRLEQQLNELEQTNTYDSDVEYARIDEIRHNCATLTASDTAPNMSSFEDGEALLVQLKKDLDRERHLRERAEMRLNVMRELHQDLVLEQSAEARAEQAMRHLRQLGSGEALDDGNTKIIA